jgi:hypothetical protein
MYIDPKSIIGKKFNPVSLNPVNDSSKDYECVGYADNGTLLIIGALFDSTNNRSNLKTFKLTEVNFFGKVTSS